jgi:hypothetical protein
VAPRPLTVDADADQSRRSKGSVLDAVRLFATREGDDAAWGRILGRIPAADRGHVEGAVAVSWIPSRVLTTVFASFDVELRAGGRYAMRDYGRFAAERDLTVLNRALLRLASPTFVIEKSTQYWRRFHSWGAWSVERDGRSFRGTLDGFFVGADYCAALTPYLGRLMELAGAKSCGVAHPACVARGDAACVYTGRLVE